MKFTEETLEQAVIELFQAENYQHVHGILIHKEISDVLLRDDLKQFLLNRYSADNITLKEIDSITRQLDILPGSALYESNRTILKWISDGLVIKREDRTRKDLFIQLVDYESISNNIFKIVNQLEIQGYEKRIPDAIVYVNGLPLVVIEFKSAVKENKTIRDAYNQLTIRYRRDIPELFKFNAICVISDGINNKSGSLFAPYDFFYSWRKIEGDEPIDTEGIGSLYSMVGGLFNHKRLLDVIHHFIYFPDTPKEEIKIVCRYPQYYAARKLYESVRRNLRPNGSGKGGTYFGATGCGKSFTMLYLTRLLMRSLDLQSPTIILITDRTDLDDQLSAQFTNAKVFIGDDLVVSVESRAELKEMISGRKSGGIFLTTVQKFTEDTELLTERTNVICISDEAHRSQVNLDQKILISGTGVERRFGFAKYLHDSLPNATYVGFTGTPIDKTLEVFGEVTDAYTMQESVEDNITVRIVYEGRAAKVLLHEEKLKEIENYYEWCLNEGASEYQVEESKKAVTQMEVILGDPDRLSMLAKDFVDHYEKRVTEGASVNGKVMFVSASRNIAWNLYKQIIALRPQWAEIRECDDGVILTETERKEIKPIEKIKLVMTRNNDDPEPLYKAVGSKDYKKELDRQFKNPKSNFKVAILVDMWLTGFDVPSLDTMYIDKPVQKHSLIQTISRVNRVYEGKDKGLIVDYIGIKGKLNEALSMYSGVDDEDFEDIEKAVVLVKDQLSLLESLFHNFDGELYFNGTPLQKLDCLNRAAEYVQTTDEMETRFMQMVKKLKSAYNLCCSSERISQIERNFIHYYFAIRSIIFKLTKGEAPDTSQMNEHVQKMVQDAIISDGVDEIFKLDKEVARIGNDIFSEEYMAKIQKIKLPNTKIKLLQRLLAKAIEDYKKVNRIKGTDFTQKLRKLIDQYNQRKESMVDANEVLEEVAEQFANLFRELNKERNSFVNMGIDFEEKAFYDILKAIAQKYKFEYPEDKLIKLSRLVKTIVDDKSKYTDWSHREDIKAELKVDLILVLADNGYPPVPRDEVFKEVFEQAENFKKYR